MLKLLCLFIVLFLSLLLWKSVLITVNHSLANGSLAWRNVVFEDTFFSVLMEKLAVTKSRLSDMETGHWWHDKCRWESLAIFLVRNADSKGKLMLQTFSGILVLLKNMHLCQEKGWGWKGSKSIGKQLLARKNEFRLRRWVQLYCFGWEETTEQTGNWLTGICFLHVTHTLKLGNLQMC